MSVSPELLHLRDMNEMEAEGAMRKVKGIISSAEFHGREHATQTMMKVFKIVHGYFEDVTTETMGDQAIHEHADSQLEARTALNKVKRHIYDFELARGHAIEFMRRIFQVVNDYVVKMESQTQTICPEAMDENESL